MFLGYLKGLVEEHLQLLMQILPQSNITLCTYQAKSSCLARQFTEWAMRFEAKHQYFKHIPCVSKIFKNLPKTLSERHQSGVCSDSIRMIMRQTIIFS